MHTGEWFLQCSIGKTEGLSLGFEYRLSEAVTTGRGLRGDDGKLLLSQTHVLQQIPKSRDEDMSLWRDSFFSPGALRILTWIIGCCKWWIFVLTPFPLLICCASASDKASITSRYL